MRTTDTTTTGGAVPSPTTDTGEDPLDRLERELTDLLPDLVGLSLCRTGPDGPVTLRASDPGVGLLDALQHLDGGPLPTRDRDVVISPARWPHLARGADAIGVGSTRACTLRRGEVVAGEVHLYAAGDAPFAGHEEAIQALLDDADLVDRVLDPAPADPEPTQAAPRSLRGDGAVHRVIGQLVVRLGVDPIAAHDRLESSARLAGVPCTDLAAALVDLRP